MSSTEISPPLPDLVDRLYHAMNRAVIRRLAGAGHEAIRLPHAAVFETIGTGARITAMADRVGVTKQAMGELVAYLERHGYVERERDPNDLRAFIIRVTDRGRHAVAVAQGVIDEMCARWTGVVEQRELEAAVRTLAGVAADVEAFADE